MKTIFVTGLTLLTGIASWAQAPQKMAVINMQEALVSTVDGKKAVADLRNKYGEREAAMQKRSQDLQAKSDQLKKTQATLSDDQKTKMSNDIAALDRALQRDAEDEKTDRDADEQKVLNELGGKLMQVVTKYAVDNQFSMVFDDSQQPNNILFAANAMDITRDVIALYDKSAAVTPTAPPAAAPAPRPAAPSAAPKKP